MTVQPQVHVLLEFPVPLLVARPSVPRQRAATTSDLEAGTAVSGDTSPRHGTADQQPGVAAYSKRIDMRDTIASDLEKQIAKRRKAIARFEAKAAKCNTATELGRAFATRAGKSAMHHRKHLGKLQDQLAALGGREDLQGAKEA